MPTISASSTTPGVNVAGTYVLTVTDPANGCSASDNAVVSADPPQTPVFSPIPAICVGDSAPVLPTVSNNGITGAWSPPTVSNTGNGTYTFTPDAGQCASPVTIGVTVNPPPDTSVIFHD